MPYSFDDLTHAYETLGVRQGGLVYVTSHLLGVADYEERGSRALIDAHYRALRKCLGEEGTLVVATASTDLCNTDTIFDVNQRKFIQFSPLESKSAFMHFPLQL